MHLMIVVEWTQTGATIHHDGGRIMSIAGCNDNCEPREPGQECEDSRRPHTLSVRWEVPT